MQINKRQLKKWIAALDSGEYKQSDSQLQDEYGYCCLGVGCKVLIPDKLQFLLNGKLGGNMPSLQPAAPIWIQEIDADFEIKTGQTLSWSNDGMGFTFPEIATLLELVYIHKILD